MNFSWKHGAGALALSAATLGMSAGAQVAPAGKPVKPPVDVVQPAPSVDVETGQLLDKGPRWPHKVERTAVTPPPVDDAAAPSAERGIKDNCIPWPSCQKRGAPVTEIEAAPPPVDAAAAPVSTEKPGRPKIRDKPVSTRSATERRAHSGPGGGPRVTADAAAAPEAARTGRPKERDPTPTNDSVANPPTTTEPVAQATERRRKGPKVRDDSVSTRTGRPKERDDSPHDTSATERRAHDGPGGTPPSTAKPGSPIGP